MKADVIFYVVTISIVTIAFGAAAFLPIPDAFRGLVALPGPAALIAMMVEAWRDKRAHERAIEVLNRQQDHSLAIASHMATVVFDRQVLFCEQYFESAHKALLELFTTGPAATALTYAGDLARIRIRYSPWLSPAMELGVLPFERAMREVGVDAQLIDTKLPQPMHAEFVQRMFDAFTKMIHMTEPLGGDSPEEAISSIVAHLRKVLGVSQMTQLRDAAISLAIERAAPISENAPSPSVEPIRPK